MLLKPCSAQAAHAQQQHLDMLMRASWPRPHRPADALMDSGRQLDSAVVEEPSSWSPLPAALPLPRPCAHV